MAKKEDEKKVGAQEVETQEAVSADMIAELKAQLVAEIKEELKAEKAEETGYTPMTEEEIAYWDELVPYHVPWIEGEEDEITVGHNGVLYKVKRGEEVQIPRKILAVLLDSEKQKREFAGLKKGMKNQEIEL